MAPIVHGLEAKYYASVGFTYLDIDDPAFGRWVEAGPVGDHQKWSAAFNREWDNFFRDNPMATRDEILRRMNELRIDPRFQ